MSGGGGGPIIILKNLRAALTVSASTKGTVRLWHVLILTHLIAWAVGKFV